ncbi:MAG TPA: amidohydrolase [Candidatus Methylomirabilis sp.]|jgi:5-methylthioadenosine/S-adenosylhomocysteine deaminase
MGAVTEARVLLRDALLVPGMPDQPPAYRGWLFVTGRHVAALGPGDPPDLPADRVVHAADLALIPGLVNAHAHSHSSLTRGSAEGLTLEGWLRVIEAEQARLTEDQAYHAALATYCEALLSGTTLVVDMCLFPEAAVRAALEVGIRAVVVPYVADGKPFTPTLAVTERLLAAGPLFGGRVAVWSGLHDLESCSDLQVQAGAALAARFGVGLHLHCAETRLAVARTVERTGRGPASHLAHLGALTPRTLLAHCVWIDEGERRALAAAGAHVVHCPHANLKLGSGIAPVPALLAQGVNVALGTDGAKANNRLDMFDVMKFASLLHKGVHTDPALLPPATVLAMASRHGAEALGIPAGALAPGCLADLVLVRLDRFHLQPALPETIVTNLVHAARGSDVDLVMVDGRVIVEGGAVRTVDAAAVRARAAALGASLLRAGP